MSTTVYRAPGALAEMAPPAPRFEDMAKLLHARHPWLGAAGVTVELLGLYTRGGYLRARRAGWRRDRLVTSTTSSQELDTWAELLRADLGMVADSSEARDAR